MADEQADGKPDEEAAGDLKSHESQRFLNNNGNLQDKETSAQSSGLSDVGKKDDK